MKHTIKNLFHSPRFVVGFVLIVVVVLTSLIYPLIVTRNPLQVLGTQFASPGTYISVYDAVMMEQEGNTIRIDLGEEATQHRITSQLEVMYRQTILDYLNAKGVDTEGMDTSNATVFQLIELFEQNYDPDDATSKGKVKGFTTKANRNKLVKAAKKVDSILHASDVYVVTDKESNPDGAALTGIRYASTSSIANVVNLPLGTEVFGHDMLTKLIKAISVSLKIGLMAGGIATLIGLMVGLLSGYVGGKVDDILMFIANLFTVVPGFILLVLINYSMPQSARGVETCAVVIGVTSWVWTARSVRSQVISLRNRDHVNLSKLSGHSLIRIVLTDILPYIASYVVMAFILQVSSGILAEAQLSMLGLGPSTTEVPTLGLMMNWAVTYNAHLSGYWWAYFPVILTIACISFSLNLMNTGMDQVFNPTLRD